MGDYDNDDDDYDDDDDDDDDDYDDDDDDDDDIIDMESENNDEENVTENIDGPQTDDENNDKDALNYEYDSNAIEDDIGLEEEEPLVPDVQQIKNKSEGGKPKKNTEGKKKRSNFHVVTHSEESKEDNIEDERANSIEKQSRLKTFERF